MPDTRDRLIQTATDLIWENSYAGVSVEDICKSANIHKGSFYHYFPSKSDLALATLDRHIEEMKPLFDQVFSPLHPPLERFDRLVDMCIDIQNQAIEKYGKACGCPFACLAMEMAPQDQRFRLKADEIIGHIRTYYESALREMVTLSQLPANTDIHELAEEMDNYVLGQVLMTRICDSLTPLERDLKKGLRRMLGNSKDTNKFDRKVNKKEKTVR